MTLQRGHCLHKWVFPAGSRSLNEQAIYKLLRCDESS